MFWTSIVHLQDVLMLYVAIWYVLIRYEGEGRTAELCSSSFTLITTGRIETYQTATYSIRTLLKMDYWRPKHVELLNSSSSFTLITTGRIETYQIATYSIRTLLKMDYWSPKHVELLNVMNKINHQILCILLDYKYIAFLMSQDSSVY